MTFIISYRMLNFISGYFEKKIYAVQPSDNDMCLDTVLS